ncbi:MAG: DUF4878 domain-containing protein [Pyrinomonadaceae bacterium]|nr:DUF4878 domain-containing protein [Pyrinomonadaceae bacterium]
MLFGCSNEAKPTTPKEAFHEYSKARKRGDLTRMKTLLSAESLKMHEQEAKAQSATVDDILKRETLVSESQNIVKVRNEKVEGEKATLEVENFFGSWETVYFVREDGEWKIDKKGYADRMMQEIEQMTDQKLDQIIQGGGNMPADNTNTNSPAF